MTEQPKLVYDDECGFCTRSAKFISRKSKVELVPFSSVPQALEDDLPQDWRECAHLVTDEEIFSCGEAMMRAYEFTDERFSQVPGVLRHVPGYEMTRDSVYVWIANHRPLVSRITRKIFVP